LGDESRELSLSPRQARDRHDAARVRRRNLVRYLEGALDMRAGTMWIAHDLGYRSGRRTGIPITDEMRLARARGDDGRGAQALTSGQVMR
jgi:hypothetical protein